jgi:hypothetical protein
MFGLIKGNGTRAYMRGLDFTIDRDAGCVRRHARPTQVRRGYLRMNDYEHEQMRLRAARRDARHMPMDEA